MKFTKMESWPADHPIYSIGAVIGGGPLRRNRQTTLQTEALNGEGYFENGAKGQPDILRQLHDIVEEGGPEIK